MPKFAVFFLGLSSLVAALLFYLASSYISQNLSPQGCRMSWMSPSYVQQVNFNSTWSPLARRYSLWLYREVGWDSPQAEGLRQGSLPVLFIPGNAGSSHQVRSIASSATRQYFSSPYVVSPAFNTRSSKPLDFYAVEFNEDLSAFHGSTLESQISYTNAAIAYILSMYPPETTIVVMGHSMGGIVATALLPSDRISAIITMSTPHTLPPARFDSRIDQLYARLQKTLDEDSTPIVSICGGATDMMIPSESCILPRAPKDVFRRTVFTSALEGAWTGVGHREMVWCHQVRWRVARAALVLGEAKALHSRAVVLDKWLRDGHSLPPKPSVSDHDGEFEMLLSDTSTLPSGQKLILKNPNASKTYLLSVPDDSPTKRLTVLVSQGSIASVSPENPISLHVSVFSCAGSSASVRCTPLHPETLKLIPNPIPGREFPVPNGSDESEGIVLFEAFAPRRSGQHWIGIKIDNADGQGWVDAGLDFSRPNTAEASTFSLLMGPLSISIPEHEGLSASFTFPNLLSNALLVYRVTPQRVSMPSCSEALMPPLLMHTSSPEETHYFPLAKVPNKHILLHTHLAAPFIDQFRHFPSALNFTIYSSAESECRDEFATFSLAIDWSATLGRWASRYLTTLVAWAAGVAAIIVFLGWSQQDQGGLMPSIEDCISRYAHLLLRYLLPGSVVLSILPLPETLYLGNKGTLFLTPIAPLLLFIASGIVCVSWRVLCIFLTMTGKTSVFIFGSRRENVSVPKTTIFSLSIVCAAIFLFVPWQVAYLGCWLLHLYTCASSIQQFAVLEQHTDAVPLVDRSGRRNNMELQSDRTSDIRDTKRDNLNHNLHLLLLMTWLLPLTAPVLAVWVRTLLTAGYTTPFDGDHNFLAVLPFLVLADYASWTPGRLFDRTSFERRVSFRWLFATLAGTAFIFGSRRPYFVLDFARIAAWIIVTCKIGRRYWGGSPWTF